MPRLVRPGPAAPTWPGPSLAAAILLGLVALAAVVRAIGLDQGLWVDEIMSVRSSFRKPLHELLTGFPSENDHPLYSLLAHLSMMAFGDGAWSARLPAMLFGVATVPALWLLGRAVASRAEALAAAGILAVSYHHVWFSQNARGYTATAFFAVLCAWLLVRGVASGSRRDFVAYGLATMLAAYTHLTMVFVSIGHAMALGIFALALANALERDVILRVAPRGFVLAALGTIALYLPKTSGVIGTFFAPTFWVGIASPSWAFAELLRGLAQGWGAGHLVLGAAAVGAGTLVFLAGLAGFWRERPLFALLAVLPPIVLYGGSLASRGVLYPRFFFFAIGPMLLVAVHGLFEVGAFLARVARRPGLGRAVPALGVAGAVAVSLVALPRNWRVPKQDFEGAARWVESQASPGDSLLSTHAAYLREFSGRPWGRGCTRKELEAGRRAGPAWVLWTLPYQLRAACPEFFAVVDRECPSPRIFPGTVSGGDVRVCRLDRLPANP
ncbi:MAG: glycosyltransferase family 39 protein [Alphaproteobacteria bacterium]